MLLTPLKEYSMLFYPVVLHPVLVIQFGILPSVAFRSRRQLCSNCLFLLLPHWVESYLFRIHNQSTDPFFDHDTGGYIISCDREVLSQPIENRDISVVQTG